MIHYINRTPYNMIHMTLNIDLSGTYYTPTSHKQDFKDLIQAILDIDNLFHKNGQPLSTRQSYIYKENTEYTFKPECLYSYEDFLSIKGDITLDILVVSRRNCSWQGYLWYDGHRYTYQSVLQLMSKILSIKEETYER